ncbi:MAG: hypothetical protein ABJB86_07615 [Bacteroidota bacterium]
MRIQTIDSAPWLIASKDLRILLPKSPDHLFFTGYFYPAFFSLHYLKHACHKAKNMVNSTSNHLSTTQKIARVLLGLFLLSAGIGHLTFVRAEFKAQVPPWLPFNPDLVVVLSGIVEILLGSSLVFLIKKRVAVGWIVAIFFVLVFPGNIAQLTEHRDAFGLNSDLARWMRLPFQGLLIFAALWSTGAWQQWRKNRSELKLHKSR